MMRIYLAFLLVAIIATSCKKGKEAAVHTNDVNAPAAHAPTLSKQALQNMGVVVKEVDSSDYVVSRHVAAAIEETPFNERPLIAPFTGRVKSISIVLGEYLKPGQAAMEIIRDPLPRPKLTLTEELLKPASDEFHNNIAALRKAKVELAINERERKRIKGFQGEEGVSLIPRKTLIDLEYEAERVTQEIANIRAKLKLHGFSETEIDGIERGDDIVLSKNLWLSALKQNGLWNEKAQTIFNALPKSVRANQWSIATIGELTAEGLVTPELITFLTESPRATENIIEIGGLLQQGNSLEDIRDLYEQGAFAPIMVIKTPLGKDWDVEAIHVKIGQFVERGTKLLTLTNHSNVYLTATPVGSEIAAIHAALAQKRKFAALPLTPGTGPELSDLQVSKIQGLAETGTRVLLPVTNKTQNMTEVDGRKFRNWQLRNRMRYILQVPHKVLEAVIVLPTEAVVDDGNDKVIYIQKGDSFERRKIVVAHRDDRVVVLGEGSEVFPQDPMVISGAFALSLALRTLGDGAPVVDAHADCTH